MTITPSSPELPTVTSVRDPAPNADGWAPGSTHWHVTLRYHGRQMRVAYHMGSALKGEPTARDVLHCLFSDARTPSDFHDFCAEFGYDEDSRKAYSTWRACLSIAIRLSKLLGSDYEAIEAAVDQG